MQPQEEEEEDTSLTMPCWHLGPSSPITHLLPPHRPHFWGVFRKHLSCSDSRGWVLAWDKLRDLG